MPKLLGLKYQKEYQYIEQEHSIIYNPLVCFKLDEGNILKDIVHFMVSYLRQNKATNTQEYSHCLKII